MIGKTTRPASLFTFAFFKEAAVIADPILDLLDRLLEDPSLLTLSTQVLATRSPEIGRAARTFIQAGQEQLKQSYKKLIGLTQGVRAQAAAALQALQDGHLVARQEALFKVVAAEVSLKHYLPLVEKVITQSQARIFRAQTRHPDKILSLFEPHSVVIRKGKAHKPNEFGRLVRIDEVEKGLVSNYAVASGNLCDQQQWVPALEAHVELFGQAPRLAAADRGFWSSANEKAAVQLGVKQVVLPACGRLSPSRAARQKQRWFRRGQGWRAGIEARLSTRLDLKDTLAGASSPIILWP